MWLVLQGYYWPEAGPANTMYVPGPILKACNNELVLLELGASRQANPAAKGAFTAQQWPSSILVKGAQSNVIRGSARQSGGCRHAFFLPYTLWD